MELLLATQQSGILMPFAWILGKILEAIYFIFSSIGIESIGLCIIVFTVVIRMLMLPSTIKQQKFSKLNSVMNPEIQAIQKKYKNKEIFFKRKLYTCNGRCVRSRFTKIYKSRY